MYNYYITNYKHHNAELNAVNVGLKPIFTINTRLAYNIFPASTNGVS